MKLKLMVIIGAFIFITACTQRTCPTYSKKDVPESEKITKKVSV